MPYLNIEQIFKTNTMIKTYRDPTSGKIYLETGEHIPDLTEYTRRVRAGEISGTPEPVTNMPKNQRTPDGGILTKNDSISNLSNLKNQNGFVDAVKDIIQRKQVIQQPLTEQKAYWRTISRDTSPFGGQRDPSIQAMPGMFTDARMRELSPSDQASVQASRFSAAQSHLQGIREEEEYRETRVEDIIGSITEMMERNDKAEKDKMDKYEQTLDLLKKKKELGLPVSDADYQGVGITSTNGKTAGSISWRNNNPGNLKFSKWEEAYGATKDSNSAFAVFPSIEKAHEAYKALLSSPTGIYAGLTPDQAMWKWSGSGKDSLPSYTYQDLVKLGAPAISKPFSLFTEEEWSQFFEAMKKREGWTEGTNLNKGDTSELEYISNLTGLSIEDLSLYTPDELDLLKSTYEELTKSDIKTEQNTLDNQNILKEVRDLVIQENNKKTDPNTIFAMLIRLYSEKLNDAQLKSAMTEAGFKWNGLTYQWEQ